MLECRLRDVETRARVPHSSFEIERHPKRSVSVIELPFREPCDLCEGMAGLGILTFQNNGVYSGQETPHFHFHVVPRQSGSDWGIGPPQLATFDAAGRRAGTAHNPEGDAQRRRRVQATPGQLIETAALIRSNLAG